MRLHGSFPKMEMRKVKKMTGWITEKNFRKNVTMYEGRIEKPVDDHKRKKRQLDWRK